MAEFGTFLLGVHYETMSAAAIVAGSATTLHVANVQGGADQSDLQFGGVRIACYRGRVVRTRVISSNRCEHLD